MTATQLTTARKTNKKSTKAARPVTHVLLELAYLMHTTKVVGVRETLTPQPSASTSV